MNLIDKAISLFSPKLGAERARFRAQETIIESKKRAYEAATLGRRGEGWKTFNSSDNANQDIHSSLKILRDRSVNGYKNNSSVFSAHRKIQNNVVGTGIMPTPTNIIGQKKLTKTEIEIIKAEWKAFAETRACDYNNVMYMGGIQSLAMRTISMQGEVLVMRRRDANSRIPFKIQILPPYMLDNQKSSYQGLQAEGNFIVQGVEFDSKGQKVGYWIYDSDPRNQYTMKISSSFVPISDLRHIFYMDFPEQVRGIPFGTPAMLNMRDLDDYEDAQLMLQKVAACHVGVTTRPMDAEGLPSDAGAYESYDHIEPGMMQHLAPGEEITFNNPPVPGSYSEYVTKNQIKNAGGFGISYESFSGDYSNVNFSSGRMGWIEMQRQVEDWQFNMFIPQFCDAIWEWFIEGLNARNIITKIAGADWTPQGREMLDPVKEMNGLILELKSGLISWTEACKKRGYNPETVMEQIKADKEMFEAAGINVEWIIQNYSESTDTEEELSATQKKALNK